MSARRITTAAAAVALAAGTAFTAVPSAGAETTGLPPVSEVTDGIQQSVLGSVILPVIAGSAVYCLITSSFSPTGEDNCPS